MEIGKAYNISEAGVRYHLKKQMATDSDERRRSSTLKMLQISALRQGLDKALRKLDNALDYCGNNNEDVKLTIDIAKFYIMALRFEQVSEPEPITTSAEQSEIDALVMDLLPKKLHAKAADGIIAIHRKYSETLVDDKGIIK